MPIGKCSNKIRRIVRIRQMLRRWRARAASSSSSTSSSPPSRGLSQPPSDVPAGHVAVVVGSSRRRYVVRASLLNHPVFSGLLVRAEEEYGFALPGPLAFPCDEPLFEEALALAARSGRRCHLGSGRGYPELISESRPLLNGI